MTEKDRMEFVISASLPEASGIVRERRLRAVREATRTFQHLVDDLAPEELEELSRAVEGALSARTPEISPEKRELIARITGGREWSSRERVALEARALLGSFKRRRRLLENSLTAPEVAALLGTSRQTPHDRAKSGTLLAVRDRGSSRFPSWQFDPEGPHGVVQGLPEVLRELRGSPLAKASWFTSENSLLEFRRPLDVLSSGEVEDAVDAARAHRVT